MPRSKLQVEFMKYSNLIAGVDEAGRGPLAGPVVACAVIFHPDKPIQGAIDSKKLSAKLREKWYDIIMEQALCVSVAFATVEEIEELNILHATMLAMQRAVEGLTIPPSRVVIDGNRCPILPYPAEAIIGGDDSVPVISAASIIAKVERDRLMIEHDKTYPEYGFAKHKGYGTQQHIAALNQWGVTPIHRKTFAPVANCLEKL